MTSYPWCPKGDFRRQFAQKVTGSSSLIFAGNSINSYDSSKDLCIKRAAFDTPFCAAAAESLQHQCQA